MPYSWTPLDEVLYTYYKKALELNCITSVEKKAFDELTTRNPALYDTIDKVIEHKFSCTDNYYFLHTLFTSEERQYYWTRKHMNEFILLKMEYESLTCLWDGNMAPELIQRLSRLAAINPQNDWAESSYPRGYIYTDEMRREYEFNKIVVEFGAGSEGDLQKYYNLKHEHAQYREAEISVSLKNKINSVSTLNELGGMISLEESRFMWTELMRKQLHRLELEMGRTFPGEGADPDELSLYKTNNGYNPRIMAAWSRLRAIDPLVVLCNTNPFSRGQFADPKFFPEESFFDEIKDQWDETLYKKLYAKLGDKEISDGDMYNFKLLYVTSPLFAKTSTDISGIPLWTEQEDDEFFLLCVANRVLFANGKEMDARRKFRYGQLIRLRRDIIRNSENLTGQALQDKTLEILEFNRLQYESGIETNEEVEESYRMKRYKKSYIPKIHPRSIFDENSQYFEWDNN